MTLKTYLLVAIVAFFIFVSGSDVFARMSVGGETLSTAVSEHLRWASLTLIGILLLCVPFIASAVVCGRANRSARTRASVTVFVLAIATLGYFYFCAFQAAEREMLEEKWTAASLSFGLLPFFFGVPVCAATWLLSFVATRLN